MIGLDTSNAGFRPLSFPGGKPEQILPVIPFEKQGAVTGIISSAETDVIAQASIPSNKKATLSDILVRANQADAIFRVYRGGSATITYDLEAADVTERITLGTPDDFMSGGGLQYDENETFRVTVQAPSATSINPADAFVQLVGKEELKRNEIFSQILV